MKFQAVKFSKATGKHISRLELDVEHAVDLLNLKEREAPGVLLLAKGCLEDLAKFGDVVIARGIKHPSKQLSDYVLRKNKIPLVEGQYRAVRSLKSSIFKLLDNAEAITERNLYLIGADQELFQQLWDQSGDEQKPLGRRSRPVTENQCPHNQAGPLNEPNDPESNKLWQELKDIKPPEELSRKFVGESPAAGLVRKLIWLAAKVDTPVLIMGDTGTGKEVVALAIHESSKRRGNRRVTVNCGAIPIDMMESLLFGHIKGSFTGAISDRLGDVKAADGGSLFLDEIGDLHPWHQVKILRVIQEKTIKRLGETHETPVNVRFIAATNRELFSMVSTGQFREDLYYRLRGLLIRTPALRQYPEDIGLLAKFFWQNLNEERQKAVPPPKPLPPLPPKILQTLQRYSWPGNARELKMVLENLATLFFAQDRGITRLTVDHLNAVFLYAGQGPGYVAGATVNPELMLHKVECFRTLRRVNEVLHATRVTLAPIAQAEFGKSSGNLATVTSGLGLRLNELDMVCRDPLYFHRDTTFSLVYSLKGKLSYLYGLMQKNSLEALKYWQKEVAPDFPQVTANIFREVDKLFT